MVIALRADYQLGFYCGLFLLYMPRNDSALRRSGPNATRSAMETLGQTRFLLPDIVADKNMVRRLAVIGGFAVPQPVGLQIY